MPSSETRLVHRAPVVLIVSEHEWASRSLDTVLAPRGYAVQRAYNGVQALEKARETRPDAVFVERSLPDMAGPEVCRRLQSEGIISEATPLIITTSGPLSQEQRVESLRSGAWEILTPPFDAEELLLRLSHYIRAKLQADRVAEKGRTDPETGFYNDAGIRQRAKELVAAAERYGRPVACVVFEPLTSDENALRDLMAEIVRILRTSTRRSDVIGRLGPKHFAIVAPDTAPDGAEILADRLRQRATAPGLGRFPARAGVFGVDDPSIDRIDPVELMDRARTASRDSGPPRMH